MKRLKFKSEVKDEDKPRYNFTTIERADQFHHLYINGKHIYVYK